MEHSRSILSVSTIGISAFIDPNGQVISETDENVESHLTGDLPLSNHITNATRWGALNKIAIISLLALFGFGSRRKRSAL